MARRSREEEVILVKVARTGSAVVEVALNGDTGHSVAAALDAANIDYSDEERIRVNGRTAESDDDLKDGDVVTLAGNIKGGTL